MNIAGLQRVSTIDYPGEIACVIFLHGCNFRCGFCYNPDLVLKEPTKGFSENYILDFLNKRRGKLDAVCITGGEPLINLDIDFVRKIRELGYKIKIDTNGSFPNELEEIIRLGLIDYIAMDIKTDKENYSKVVNTSVDFEKIERSIKLIHDFGNYEFRTTIVGRFHNSEKMKKIGKWLNEICGEKPNKLFLQGFRKNKEGMIDMNFLNEQNVGENFLEKLKSSIEEFFNEVIVR